MKSKKSLLILVIVFVVLIAGASVLYNFLGDKVDTPQIAAHDHNHEHTDETDTAPDFTVTDINGNQVNLSDFFGKPIVVNFWASWCGPCKTEMPEFNEAYQEYKNDIHFLMVNMTDGLSETTASASKFIKESGYAFPVYFDTSTDAALTYSVYSIPTTIFIDSEGHLSASAQGVIDRETLQKGINMIYKQ